MVNLSSVRDKNQLIGVVTVLFNSDAVLPDFFYSLATQGLGNIRLYIIDNSPKNTGITLSNELAKKYSIDTFCIFNEVNNGVAGGNNQGIEMALKDNCAYILLANNDIEFQDGVVVGLLESMLENKAQAIAPKIYYHDNEKTIWYGGGEITKWMARVKHYGIGAFDDGKFDFVMPINYAPTCFMLLESDVFKQIGLMDDSYFCYYDDTDFVFRLNNYGMHLFYDSRQVIFHKVSSSTGGDESDFSLFYANRNRIYFIRKNFKGLNKFVALLWVIATRFLHMLTMNKPRSWRLYAAMKEGLTMPIKSI